MIDYWLWWQVVTKKLILIILIDSYECSPTHSYTVDGILRHQSDGWNPINGGINHLPIRSVCMPYMDPHLPSIYSSFVSINLPYMDRMGPINCSFHLVLRIAQPSTVARRTCPQRWPRPPNCPMSRRRNKLCLLVWKHGEKHGKTWENLMN